MYCTGQTIKLETLNLVLSFVLENLTGRINNFPAKRRGLGHVTPKNFWHTIEHIFKIT